MHERDHGEGVFGWDVYCGYDYLTAFMKADCRNIHDEYDFFDYVKTHNDGYYSREEFLYWFHSMWRFIPKNMLYKTYKELLAGTDFARGRWAYKLFFMRGLREEIMKVNKHDTVDNPLLRELLDDKGYLTVYNSGCEKKPSHSWMLNKEKAIKHGEVEAAIVHRCDNYTFITGKVKLENVISYIRGHVPHEITVRPHKVIGKVRESLSVPEDFFTQ